MIENTRKVWTHALMSRQAHRLGYGRAGDYKPVSLFKASSAQAYPSS